MNDVMVATSDWQEVMTEVARNIGGYELLSLPTETHAASVADSETEAEWQECIKTSHGRWILSLRCTCFLSFR